MIAIRMSSLLAKLWSFGSMLLALVGLASAEDAERGKTDRNPRLIIVAAANFQHALQEFIDFKKTLRPTEFASLESILSSSPGVDAPEKLKRWLFEEWKQRGLGYVLLVGDVNLLPVRYMVLDRVTPAAFDYAFYPSDLYYSDLAKSDGSFEDWNAATDSFHQVYFGEVRGEKNKSDPINYDQVDYRPDVSVGRWPVETIEEVERIARKTIAFEKSVLDGTSPHLHRAALIAVGGWVDSRGVMDRLAQRLEPNWTSTKQYYSDRARPSKEVPTRPATRALFNNGVSLIVHAGHGQSDAWEQCFSVADLDEITNAAQLPVVISAGCSTSYFAPLPPYNAYVDVHGVEHKGTDQGEHFKSPPPPPNPIQTGRFNPTGLGEQILKRNEHGAVAYIGCNTGSQPCGLTLVEGFITSVGSHTNPCLGDCWSDAVEYYYENEHLADLQSDDGWYPPSIFFQGMKFMLFGDPSLTLP
jgi:hypothetical protein